ncbi:MAG: RNA polymerase sigma factor [Planctomycetota bacterium]
MTQADTGLLDRAVAGDAAALRPLLEQHGPQVRAVIRRKIAPRWQALLDEDDVMQVTYLEAFLHIEQLVARDPASFATWLMRIAENVLHDTIRELERQKRAPAVNPGPTPGADDSRIVLLAALGRTSSTPSRRAARDEAAGILDCVMRKLPPDYQTVVQLVDLEGRTLAEAATAMGRSVGAVHMLRLRAHRRLRELLGSESRYFSD